MCLVVVELLRCVVIIVWFRVQKISYGAAQAEDQDTIASLKDALRRSSENSNMQNAELERIVSRTTRCVKCWSRQRVYFHST